METEPGGHGLNGYKKYLIGLLVAMSVAFAQTNWASKEDLNKTNTRVTVNEQDIKHLKSNSQKLDEILLIVRK